MIFFRRISLLPFLITLLLLVLGSKPGPAATVAFSDFYTRTGQTSAVCGYRLGSADAGHASAVSRHGGHCKSRSFRKRQRGLPASTPVLPTPAAPLFSAAPVHAPDARLARRLPYRQELHGSSQYGFLFRLTPF